MPQRVILTQGWLLASLEHSLGELETLDLLDHERRADAYKTNLVKHATEVLTREIVCLRAAAD